MLFQPAPSFFFCTSYDPRPRRWESGIPGSVLILTSLYSGLPKLCHSPSGSVPSGNVQCGSVNRAVEGWGDVAVVGGAFGAPCHASLLPCMITSHTPKRNEYNTTAHQFFVWHFCNALCDLSTWMPWYGSSTWHCDVCDGMYGGCGKGCQKLDDQGYSCGHWHKCEKCEKKHAKKKK